MDRPKSPERTAQIADDDWQQQLAEIVKLVKRRREQQAELRSELQRRRDAGLQRRHRRKIQLAEVRQREPNRERR